jgi:hypothetical protein
VPAAELDPRLVLAALGPPERAAAAWAQWRQTTAQADAPAILSWAGGYIHRNLERAGTPDRWLAGVHRHNWLANNRRIVQMAPLLRALNATFSIVPLKSLAQSVDGESRGLRPVADVDVFVRLRHLEAAGRFLEAEGFRALLEAGSEEVATRIGRRGGSWNFVDGAGGDVDLHWRLFEHLSVEENQAVVWDDVSVRDSFFGPCPQLSAELLCLHVAVHYWADPAQDRYHGLFDFASLAGRADARAVWSLADRLQVSGLLEEVNGHLGAVLARPPLGDPPAVLRRPRPRLEGVDPRTVAAERIARGETPGVRPNPDLPERAEPERLRHPLLYRWWAAAGRRSRIERALIGLLGPMSKVDRPHPTRLVFSARHATHRHLGPGWNVQYELDGFRWTDGPDARVVLGRPQGPGPWRLELDLDPWSWSQSATRYVDVFADGRFLGRIEPGPESRHVFSLRRHGGPRRRAIEVSLRPRYPLPFADMGPGVDFFRLSLPVVSVAVVADGEPAPA